VPPLRERGKDIDLLFRKFASDFAEKYKVKPITVADDAKDILLKYRFPGNIRQLKNLVEQMSVLSTDDKIITIEKLNHYLPQETSLPAIYRNGNHAHPGESFSERDILYKVLFDMKKDMVDLKKIVLEAFQHQGTGAQLVKEHPELFKDVEHATPVLTSESVMLNLGSSVPGSQASQEEEVHDISHETEEDSLSIEKKEKELILRALVKNNNKRKYAARDLGISERTLYRKIKQYHLEE
jgi:transcriptional regulator with PAS, ATPase and Fis domain